MLQEALPLCSDLSDRQISRQPIEKAVTISLFVYCQECSCFFFADSWFICSIYGSIGQFCWFSCRSCRRSTLRGRGGCLYIFWQPQWSSVRAFPADLCWAAANSSPTVADLWPQLVSWGGHGPQWLSRHGGRSIRHRQAADVAHAAGDQCDLDNAEYTIQDRSTCNVQQSVWRSARHQLYQTGAVLPVYHQASRSVCSTPQMPALML